jgi:two-component system, NtrC family, nitrogen regulation sensor histidine kinase NtrY
MDKDKTEKQGIKKERIFIVVIILMVAALTFIEIRITDFGSNIPISNTILMFTLININLLLLLTLLLLVFRNLAKLYYEKKSKLLGSKLKTRLTIAFITLSLLPTIVLFFFSIHFISASIAFWFNAPVEKTLNSSLAVGQKLYEFVEEKNLFFAERAAYQIETRKLLKEENGKELSRYVQIVQRAFDRDAIEIYTPGAKRMALSIESKLEEYYLDMLTSDELTTIAKGQNVKTITQSTFVGEFIKTISTIPFNVEAKEAKAFIVISSLAPPGLSSDLISIATGFEEYQQLIMAKKPVQITNYIALSIVALLVVFCAVWFGFHIAESITTPISKFAEGTQRISQGDLNYQIDFETDDEIGMLISSFNKMTKDLASGREKLARSEKLMIRQNIELEKSRRYMEIVLENVSAGVVTLDNKGKIITLNKAAESMLSMKSENVLNKHWKDFLTGDYLDLAQKILSQISPTSDKLVFPLSVAIHGVPRYFSIHYNSLTDDTGHNIGAVMVFDDLTELEKAQRVAAWREVARRIAHEVKNPLTPINLSAQRLKRKYAKQINEDIFDTCTNTITEQVEHIRNLVNQFSTFAKFPEVNLQQCNIETVVTETIALYKEGLENVRIETDFGKDVPVLSLDSQHMKQAFINLFDNAVSAINSNGVIQVQIVFDEILQIVTVVIADDGKGIADSEKIKLFEPYFSTKTSGMGLGLAIVNTIITDHHGSIRVQDNEPTGAKFIIELPA